MVSYLTWSQILPANTKQNHFWKMTTVPLVFFWDTLIMQLSLWQEVLASRKKRTLSFTRRGWVLIFWLVTMQENPNVRIGFENIKLKLGTYKAFFSLFPPTDCHDAGKASYHTSLLLEDHHHRFGRNLFWKVLWTFFLFNIVGLSVVWQGWWSMVGSILCVGLRQQRQPFLLQNQLTLVYFDMQ